MERWLIPAKNAAPIVSTEASPPDELEAAPSPETEVSKATPPTEIQSTSRHTEKRKSKLLQPDPTKRRKYCKSFIQYGFTCLVKNGIDHPQCVLCTEVLAHESLKPTKMDRHLKTKHPLHADKSVEFFVRKEGELNGQRSVVNEQTTVSVRAQLASYEVAYLIAKSKKPHTIGETLIRPAAFAMTRAMHSEKIASALNAIPLSNDTISRRIDDMASDIKCQLIERIKKSGTFSLQLDESTDISNAAQLLVFVRYSFEGKLHEDMLFCAALEGTCTGNDIFRKLDGEMREFGLCWEHCVGVCTDGAGAMQGKKKGLKAKVLEVAPHARFTHCVIHREALASKSLDPEVNAVLQTAVKMVNFIKSRPLNTRLFSTLCQEMGSEHETLLFHTEVRWLSRGKVLTRLFELREEVRIFLADNGSPLADHLTDTSWVSKLAYMAGIFDKLNSLNLSLQGPNTNILTLSDKVNGFSKKLERWAERVESGNVEMFPELDDFLQEKKLNVKTIKRVIITHLRGLLDEFKKYFPKDQEDNEWVRQPFIASGNHLPSELEDALLDLASDRTLKTLFESKPLDEFWLMVAGEYPGLSKAAMEKRIPFGSTYLCENTFSTLTYIKNKQRSRLRVEDSLRVAVSSIQPRMQHLCSRKQAQPSH